MAELTDCFVCGAHADAPSFDGTHTDFNGSPGYGSCFDLSGTLRIYVCDGCLEVNKSRVTRLVTKVVKSQETSSWMCPVCDAATDAGGCVFERGISWLSKHGNLKSTDNPKMDNLLLGTKNQKSAYGYMERYKKHAEAAGLSEVEIMACPSEDRHDRWTVYAVSKSD